MTKIKLVALDFDYAIIEQNLRELITEKNKLPYAYNRLNSTDLLCNRDDNSSLKNPLYNYTKMNKLIDELFKSKQLTINNIDSFKTNIKQSQEQGIVVAVATRSSRIDEIDYILQKVLGKDHDIIIVGSGGGANHKKAHLEKIIKVANLNNTNPVKISEALLIDDKRAIINNTIGKEKEHLLGIQIKPGCANDSVELASHFTQTGKTKCIGNESTFFLEFSCKLPS